MPKPTSADVYGVRSRISIILLVAAATALITIVATRSSNATRAHRDSIQPQVPVYGTTPALASQTLAKLRAPQGFKRTSDCHLGQETVCFARSTSLRLDAHVVARLLGATGAALYAIDRAKYGEGLPPIACRTAGIRFRLSFQSCDAEAVIDHERLSVSVNSAEMIVRGSRQPTTRSPKGFAHPIEIHISVIGHFLHNATPER